MEFLKDKSIKKEVKIITVIILILDIILYIGMFLYGKYGISVILGIILGSIYAIFNFIMIAINMELLINSSKNKAKTMAILGYLIRYILAGVVIYMVGYVKWIDTFSFIITLFFPKIAIFCQAAFSKKISKL